MNHIYEEMLKLGAEGVIFHPIFQNVEDVFSGKCQIHSIMTLEQVKNSEGFPKSGRTYYKIVNGKKVEVKENAEKEIKVNKYELDFSNFESLSSKILFESHRFYAKYNVKATKVFLDPKTYLIINYGCVKNNIDGTGLEYGDNTIEKLYGIQVEVVPCDSELIKFGFRNNMDTAMAFVNGR